MIINNMYYDDITECLEPKDIERMYDKDKVLRESYIRGEKYFRWKIFKLLIEFNYDFDKIYRIIKFDIDKTNNWSYKCKEIEIFTNVFQKIKSNNNIQINCNNSRIIENKKPKLEQYTAGIYQIYNIKNKYCYVGSAINILTRWMTHKNQLKNNKHANKCLQDDWNKYGEDNFKFNILEIISDNIIKSDVDSKYLRTRERVWIEKIKYKLYNRGVPIDDYNYFSMVGIKPDYDIIRLIDSYLKGKTAKEKIDTINSLQSRLHGLLCFNEYKNKTYNKDINVNLPNV